MKLKEKEYKIFDNERPKILLLGNGLCRAFGGMSWDDFLDDIKDKDLFPLESSKYNMPMPLKAEMLTNNTLATSMRKIVKESDLDTKTSWKDFTSTNIEMRNYIRDLILDRFDYVLTTNYSYEIEAGLLNKEVLSPKKIKELMNFTEVESAQTQFLVNTFNFVNNVPVWHIHGEARKPDSMIIGNYYYGKILKRCVERLDGTSKKIKTEENKEQQEERTGKTQNFKRNIKERRKQKIGSWIDAFVLGDVYIIGLGLDFSEIDLWWLLEYKRNNPELAGKTVFYDPRKDQTRQCPLDSKKQCGYAESFVPEIECRNILLKNVYGVTVKDLDYTIKNKDDYKGFYKIVLEDLFCRFL